MSTAIYPPHAARDTFWHNVRLSSGKTVRVGWSDGRWRTVRNPVSPKLAAELGWEYVGLDTLPETEPNY